MRSTALTELLVAYGTVVPAPGSIRAFNAPFDAVVSRLHVSRGQRVNAGQPLIDVSPSPDTKLLLEGARSALRLAQGRAADAKARLELGLVTRDELLLQEQALADAEAKWATYSQWADGLKLTAATDGVVDRMPVSEGQRVPAGNLMLSVVAEGRYEAALGVEPEDAALIAAGQSLTIEPLGESAPSQTVPATVRNVSLAVDSATRLITVLAVPRTMSHRVVLGEYVRATIPVRSGTGLAVPRSAVLQQDREAVLFIVRGGRALRRVVTVGVETDSLVQVRGQGVQPGDSVVVLGNYELSDGMRVRTAADSLGRGDSAGSGRGRGGR
ncbi:MAG: efflux RND transporter periplasmic adaptor subunit [Gemmatimonadota bacterium]|nr:efflux RND transporter periplasmic adaptor subunit [Gemmatimonadota bacterium]